jgi:hypothetical protein
MLHALHPTGWCNACNADEEGVRLLFGLERHLVAFARLIEVIGDPRLLRLSA